ncbi:hypothetical protein QJ48_05720 [Paenibacillus sp. A3]|uniref:S-layer homology domain-containing protein n=1 Tax=Paenibacillus sp. A3 TaxID=1337054 RepID=UPI0006D5ABB8|nr:S-layer homology domain-containing protein [Paenibacillus sp. A3]KPV60423.1 hypothetical protein QJ48_05720 [Paenibacillus sp. A3]
MKPLKKAIITLAGCGILWGSFSSGTQAHWLFQDIDNVTWAQNSIINAYQMQVVDGVSEDRFDPESSVTWAQFVKMIVMTDNPAYRPGAPSEQWWEPYVNEAQKSKGFVDGSLSKEALDRPITRLDIARIVARLLDTSLRFKEVDEAKAASIAKDAGILQGRSGGDLALKEKVTRAESAVIIDRLFEKNGKYGKRFDTAAVKADQGTVSVGGLALGQSRAQVKAVLGTPFFQGEDEVNNNPMEMYKNFIVIYMDDQVKEVTYKAADAELYAGKKALTGAAVFQGLDTTYYYFQSTGDLLAADARSVRLGKADKYFTGSVQAGDVKPINDLAKKIRF